MAHHKSALKRVRQNLKRRERNRHHRSSLRTALKKFRSLLTAKDSETAQKELPTIQQAIDKAVTKGVVHRNTAARYKSRLAAALKRMQAA